MSVPNYAVKDADVGFSIFFVIVFSHASVSLHNKVLEGSSFSPHANVSRTPEVPPLSKMSSASLGLLASSYHQYRGRTVKPRVPSSQNNSPVANHSSASSGTPRHRVEPPLSRSPFRQSLRSFESVPRLPPGLPLSGSPPYTIASTESIATSRLGNVAVPLSEGATTPLSEVITAGKFVQNIVTVKEEVEAESSNAMVGSMPAVEFICHVYV